MNPILEIDTGLSPPPFWHAKCSCDRHSELFGGAAPLGEVGVGNACGRRRPGTYGNGRATATGEGPYD